MNAFRLMIAPMQGFTEAVFRHCHAAVYGLTEDYPTYFSPFLRVENGSVRLRDLRDITSPLNANHRLLPQIICRDEVEFNILSHEVAVAGYDHVDLNLGCPFVLQVRKGRGSGLLAAPDRLQRIADAMGGWRNMSFSVKMRLGIDAPDEWRSIVEILNSMQLTHVTVHPRTAGQQYGGNLWLDDFAALCAELKHPVVFNGDIATVEDILALRERFPGITGVMLGRGLLRRPSLVSEFTGGREWTRSERVEQLLRLHGMMASIFASTLCGDTQILMKIKPFWEYFGGEFDRRQVKKIGKATRMATYQAAVQALV